MSENKIMRPIRQTEMDYWNFTIDNEYDNRKNSLKSEMVDEINDIADTNYPKFMKALKIDKLTKEVQKLYKDYHKFKSEKELIHYLIKAAGYGSNLLLNVGPMPNGKIQPKHKTSLKTMGNWLKENGATIYGTRKGPIPPNDDFVSTQKGKTVFLHILNPEIKLLHMEQVPVRIKSVIHQKSNTDLDFRNDRFGFVIDLSKIDNNSIDTIVEIKLK